MWKEFAVLSDSGLLNRNITFDFERYEYRAISSGAGFSDPLLYSGETTNNYYVLFRVPSNSYLYITPGMTVDGVAAQPISQGNNNITKQSGTYYKDRVTFERLSKWTPPNFQPKIGGTIRETEMAWVKVDGQLREVDKVWTKVNNALREV